MRRLYFQRCLPTAGMLLCLLSIPQVYAENEQYRLMFDLGYRAEAGFEGSRDLYRSQLDYGEGPRLFGGDFQISAPQGANTYFDRFQLKLNGWGGEPYNSLRLRVSKSEIYELKFDYQNVQYYNSLPRLANPFFGQGNLQSQHTFDIGQGHSSLQLRFRPGKTISPYLSWDRNDRRGPVRTTLSEGGDDFVIRSLYDTYSNDFRGGVNLNFSRFNLLLEQGYRHYRETTDLSVSGLSSGYSSRLVFGRDIVLTNYFADNDSTANIPFSNAVAAWRPVNSLFLRGKVSYSMAGLEPHFSDQVAGTFFSIPLAAFYTGYQQQIFGNVKKPSILGDFSAEWQPMDRVRIIERFNTYRFHIASSGLANSVFLQFEPVLENRILDQFVRLGPVHSYLSVDTDVQELEGVVYVVPRVSVRVGHRFERKEVTVQDTLSYDRNVLIAGVSYEHSLRNRISAEYEHGSTDQPIMRTDTVDFHRARLRGRFSPFEKLEFDGTATLFDNDNDIPSLDYTARHRDYALQFNYTPMARVTVSGGFERSDIRTNVFYVVPQTFTTDEFFYREKGNFGNVHFSLLLPRSASLSVGYAVSGISGDFPINYHRPVARLEVPVHDRLSVYGQWNYYGYNEKLVFLPQDYRAHLAIFGFRITVDRP